MSRSSKYLPKFVHNYLNYPADRQTNKQTKANTILGGGELMSKMRNCSNKNERISS